MKDTDLNQIIKNNLTALQNVDVNSVERIALEILALKNNGGTLYLAGNGGSSSTASHFVNDLTKATSKETSRSNIKVTCLSDNVALITAISNDISYDDIFSYQLNKFGKPNDILLLFSVSGSSKNILKCAKEAKRKKIKIISFTGFNGGKIKKLSKYNINFTTNNFGIVEDCHLSIMHFISQYIRNINFKSSKKIINVNF